MSVHGVQVALFISAVQLRYERHWFVFLICELWLAFLLTLIAVADDLDFYEDKFPTVDCLAACRFDLTTG